MFFSRIFDFFYKKGFFILACLFAFNVSQLKAQGRNCGTMIYLEQQKKDDLSLAKI
jgi:hypothetical protein